MGMEAFEGTLHIFGFRGMVLEYNDLFQFLVHIVIFSTGRCWNIWVLELSREGVNSGVTVAEGKFVGALSMFEVGFHVHDGAVARVSVAGRCFCGSVVDCSNSGIEKLDVGDDGFFGLVAVREAEVHPGKLTMAGGQVGNLSSRFSR